MIEFLQDTIGDLVEDLMYHDRKDDGDLPVGAIQNAIDDNKLTLNEIVATFKYYLVRRSEF